jgi:hypothetical protein
MKKHISPGNILLALTKVKIRFVLEQAVKGQRGSKVITLLFL